MTARPTMDAGELTRRVTVQFRIDGTGSSGFPMDDWTTTPARVVPMLRESLTSAERFRGDQITAKYDSAWQMGYARDMDPETNDLPKDRRLVWKGRTLDIVGAEILGERQRIRLMTTEKADV